jgi:cellobiose phosphorylase
MFRKKQDNDFFELLPNAIQQLKRNIIEPFFTDNTNKDSSPSPYRAEIYTREKLQTHAIALAKRHVLLDKPTPERLLRRLDENERILLEVYSLLTESFTKNKRIAPAAEWLLDNFYLIEEHIYTGKKHLPKGYSKTLPQLLKGDSAGLPRVYDLAVEIISHSDGHVDLANLTAFINAYQTISTLKIGELWAIPIMLRLALLENIRRLAIIIAEEINNKALANDWADKMIETAEKDPKNLVLIIADMARSEPPMEATFVAELTRRLQEKGNALSLPLNWLEQRVNDVGISVGELIQEDNQRQAAAQVSISNSISSLRFLGTTDWRDFVEETSTVDAILRKDPDAVYALMDFSTRDLYRHAVEKIARTSSFTEEAVTELVVFQSQKAKEKEKPCKQTHVGYWLTGKGYYITVKNVGARLSFAESCRKFSRHLPLFVYLGSILLLTTVGTIPLIAQADFDIHIDWKLALISLLTLIAVSRLAVALINWLISILTRPSQIPHLDYSKGIPEKDKTMVVIPTLISTISGIDDLVENLEVRFLANRDENLYFALLTDFKDADQEILPEDETLLQAARNRILALNRKYHKKEGDYFYLFHRPRKWNRSERKWMGYERKRGKLAALNAVLRGKAEDAFMEITGDRNVFPNIKYIITLDTDTQLPRDSAKQMIAAMAHPLNHPVFNEKKRRVTEGYTILQPRVSNSLPIHDNTLYATLHSNEAATDPYTKAISDVYQDMFAEGSFIGKGIYDLDAFEKALDNRFPENRILSHDLLEGCYSRAGLLTDVQLYEEYPTHYESDMMRRHRWVRGDWQIARWILPWVPSANKKTARNPISAFSRWKIFDNLRRSLVPIALLSLFVYGWIFSSAPLMWTIAIASFILIPSLVGFSWDLVHKPSDVHFHQQLMYSIRSFRNAFVQQLLELSFLPYEAFMNLHAILITLWRMFISKRKLLEWNPFSNTAPSRISIFSSYKKMWTEPAFAVLVYGWLTYHDLNSILFALPFLSFWMAGPLLAYAVSKPIRPEKPSLSEDQSVWLRILSRKIWAFFERFVIASDNWLPPDNYQEEPADRIAHRTSPTNIGLSLLANLSAYDFGYISMIKAVERSADTMHSLQRMEKFRGHLYNWYDTETLMPLYPRYVSTVDSGNLAGHLLVMKQGLLCLPDQKLIHHNFFRGLIDTLNVTIELAQSKDEFKRIRKRIKENAINRFETVDLVYEFLNELEEAAERLVSEPGSLQNGKLKEWIQKFKEQIDSHKELLEILAPWLNLHHIPEKFTELVPELPAVPTLKQVAHIEQILLQKITEAYANQNSDEEIKWLNHFRSLITDASRKGKEMMIAIENLANRCQQMASGMEWDFLFDKAQNLLSIGYNVEDHRRDASYYDLLASEARLTTYAAIAMGKLPQDSWFALGRQLTNQGNAPVLLSWSGSMFEYLMPNLVMPTYENTLLDQTNKSVIQKQIEYGRKKNIPWGISESGYSMVDAHLNYQYKAFGVPGLGFKRGLGEDLVVAPYATVMSLMIDPSEAYDNLKQMAEQGFMGDYGFYEAIDYTSTRVQRKQKYAIIQSFMAHHQGMSFLALANVLDDRPMQKRFEAEVHLKSALLLLQERIPRVTSFYSPTVHAGDASLTVANEGAMRVISTAFTPVPEIQLLSNGRYHVMVTNSGGGYSRWKNLSVNRWREDTTCDNWGNFCYIRDLENKQTWSSAFQPTLQHGDSYESVFSQGRAEFRRRDLLLETHTEIVVSPEDDIELKRIHISNKSRKKRTLEITSYAEVVLAPPAADEAHPAFSNLFVQTELRKERHAILCTRRPRSVDEKTPWMFHLMKVHDAKITNISYETDREKFIGRGKSVVHPQAMETDQPLEGNFGSVLDPIVAIQYRIELEGSQSVTIDLITGIAENKDWCNQLVDKYQERHMFNRVLELAWTHSQVILRQINANESDAQLYARLAGSVVFSNPLLRADAAIIAKNRRGQSGLWSYSISGDLPIVLVHIEDSNNIQLVKQMVQAHQYWRLKGLIVDLVIWNDDHGGYRQELHNQIQGLLAPGLELRDQPGGIFIRNTDQISPEDRILFQAVAHVIISDRFGSLEEQLNRRTKIKSSIPYFSPSKFYPTTYTEISPRKDLEFENGYGGFTKDGKEYVIYTKPDKRTPAPWVNVIANPGFGTVVSESGQGYTWMENAHSYRLSPWNNDPVGDLKGEAIYLKDEESGKFWSPTLLPAAGSSPYVTRHGFGYSVFEHSEDGMYSETSIFVHPSDPIKYWLIKIRNHSGRKRKISATGYVEWVLGDLKNKNARHIVTELETQSGAILASNNYSSEFAGRVAFFDASGTNKMITGDRTEFIGRNGTIMNPDGLNRARLSGKTGALLDPCAVIQVVFDLNEDEEFEVVFRLGAGPDQAQAIHLINGGDTPDHARQVLMDVHQLWNDILQRVYIETPDMALNMLTNGWLNYQTLSSRVWGRSGFYQSGGAFGFRDQLQDVLSLMHNRPDLVRSQIVLAASRQFREGDVQHWWHPPAGRGVRTTCSDDYLWLPYVCARYIETTGDVNILDEQIRFLEGRLLNPGEESYYDLPGISENTASLYEHCKLAIQNGLKFGAHGLPLIGSGDWNDGMDKVGAHGKGESVWLAFFLYDVLVRFENIAGLRSDEAFIELCKTEAEKLKKQIHSEAWDGQWFKRAFFDDGSPLGSSVNEECKIDSIAQSWSVISGAGTPSHQELALSSAEKYLVEEDIGIIQLFDPPFDKSKLNPGYIQGYVPGVRENGGQYTHAAIWLVMAMAQKAEREKAAKLLSMINPINRTNTEKLISIYRTEPYVIAADVYAEPKHKGRGGWTWYTGSAGWMYQLIIENILGVQLKGNTIQFNPRVPKEWSSFKLYYQFQQRRYVFDFHKNENLSAGELKFSTKNGEPTNSMLRLSGAEGEEQIRVEFGEG